ncbi:MAG: DMT family transporter, partial [Pseudomonadota bacterium]
HQSVRRGKSVGPREQFMPYTYSFLLFLAIGSYLVFNEIPDAWTLTGAGIIVISGLIIWRRTNIGEQPA